MAGKGDRNMMDELIQAEPGQEAWAALVKDLPRAFARLDFEDQVKAAERLAGLAGNDQAQELIGKLYGQEGAGLPALIILGKALNGTDKPGPELIAEMEKWAAACEGEESECGPTEFFSLPGNVRRAVADHLALWLKADMLSALKDAAPTKDQQKMLAKALHRARSAGASVSPEAAATFHLAERDEYIDEAYMSPPDATGTCFFYLYRTVFGKNTFYVVLANDLAGVLKLEAYQVPLPKFRKILESTKNNPLAVVAKVEPGFARFMIKKSEESGRRLGKPQSEDYLGNRRAIGVADAPDQPHPLWNKLDPDALKTEKGLVFKSGELIGLRLFEDWMLAPLEEGKFIAELAEKQASVLQLSEHQKREQEDAMYEREAKRAIEQDGRDAWRGRLTNCAYVFSLLGEDDNARICAAIALTVADPAAPVPPFFTALLRRTVARLTGKEDDKKGPGQDRGGLVIV
ncbi:MAG TPA: hypothetical protein VM658_08185 [bacterium]|nr:hypothetical protein [bacterium]